MSLKLKVTKPYDLSDIPVIHIPSTILAQAKESAKKMDIENRGKRTRDGGEDKDVKGFLGQWAVHTYLEEQKWQHEYEPPYVKDQHGDRFDIRFCGDVWDVKCRNWWKGDYFYNIGIYMATHELTEAKTCDYYVFCTVDKDYQNVYILGVQSHAWVWERRFDGSFAHLKPVDKRRTRFDTAGELVSRDLIPIKDYILRA